MPDKSAVPNLDQRAAQRAQAVIAATSFAKPADVDNTVTRSLGVLQENGIYACALYLLSRRREEARLAQPILTEMLTLLGPEGLEFGTPDSEDHEDILRYLSNHVVADLPRLLLAKQTLEQMMIYVRYGAKARNASEQPVAPPQDTGADEGGQP